MLLSHGRDRDSACLNVYFEILLPSFRIAKENATIVSGQCH